MTEVSAFEFHPVTAARWHDLERLFSFANESGAGNPARCWCMELRRPSREWRAQSGDGNRDAMRGLVESDQTPGLLAYDGDEPVAWCSIAPRRQFAGLKELSNYKAFENPGIWYVTCFYVREDARRSGVMAALLRAATKHAGAHGANVIEGYPADPEADEASKSLVYMGLASVFREAGFAEVDRRGGDRMVMRYYPPEN